MTKDNHYQYSVGGTLAPTAPTYVQRKADEQFYKCLKDGEFSYVFTSRQMGKSSLLVRTKQRLETEGIVCAVIDLSYLTEKGLNSTQWYAGIVKKLANRFLKNFKFSSWWRERRALSPIQRLDEFIEQVLLPQRPENLVIFIDEIEKVLSLNFDFDGFFATIRSWYNKRAENPEYERLNIALLGVAIPAELVKDKAKTPFNIGEAIELTTFTREETQPLIQGLEGKVDDPQSVLREILDWSGGQPFLTQKLCNLVAQNTEEKNPDLGQLVQRQIIQNWEAQDDPQHLRTIRDRLLRDEKHAGRLLGLYQKIWSEHELAANYNAEETDLLLSGLVMRTNGTLKVYNPIYKAVFDQNWIDAELAKLRPYAEAIAAWEVSGCKDESRLLRGKALQEAREWSTGKSLSDIDYQFLEASLELAKREVQLALESQEKRNRSLAEINQKINDKKNFLKRLSGSLIIVSIFLVIAIFFGINSLRELEIRKKELEINNALLESYLEIEKKGKLDILLSTIETGQNILKDIDDDSQPNEQSFPDTRRALIDLIENIISNIIDTIQEQNQLEQEDKDIRSIIFHPDGEWLAIASRDDKVTKVKLQNLKENKEIKFPYERLGNSILVDSISFSPDGEWLAIASEDGYVLWNWQNNKLQEKKIKKTNDRLVYDISFPKKQGKQLAVTLEDGTIFLLNWQTAQIDEEFKFNEKEKTNTIDVIVSFSPDGQRLATASDKGQVKLWNLQGKLKKEVKEEQKHEGQINDISFSPDGKWLATASTDKTLGLWNVEQNEGNEFKKFRGHQDVVNSVSFSPDGKYLVTASSDKTVRLWDLDGNQLKKFTGHQDTVNDVSFRSNENPNPELLVSASQDGTVRLWNLKRNPIKNSFTSLIFSSEGEPLATLSNESNAIIKLWNGSELSLWDKLLLKENEVSLSDLNEEKKQKFDDPLDYILTFSPDRKLLIAVSESDYIVRLLNLQGDSTPVKLEGHKQEVYGASFSHDGKLLATASSDGTVRLWNLDSQNKLKAKFLDVLQHDSPVYSVSFSPNEELLATGSSDGKVKLWDFQGNLLHKDKINQEVYDVSFSPDGKLIAIASKDGTISLWNNWEEENIEPLDATKQEEEQGVYNITFSPDGKLIATRAEDQSVSVWNLQGKLLAKFKNYQGEVSDLVFSPDGKRLAIASTDGTIKVLQVEASALERLERVLERGCDWLHQDYFQTHPEKLEKLDVCQRESAKN